MANSLKDGGENNWAVRRKRAKFRGKLSVMALNSYVRPRT
jgi:hypothetical protein